MNGSVLVDTNVFVYAVDRAEPVKREIAERTLERSRGRVVVSTQVLMETYRVLSSQRVPARSENAVSFVRSLAAAYPVLPVTASVVAEALSGIERFGFSTWDAQLWATAKVHGVPAILTEDRQCVGTADGVRFVDPFA